LLSGIFIGDTWEKLPSFFDETATNLILFPEMSSRFLWLMICLKYKKGSSPLIFYYSFCILNSEERYFSTRILAVIILNKNVWCYWNVYIYFHFSFSLFTLIKFKLTHSVSSITQSFVSTSFPFSLCFYFPYLFQSSSSNSFHFF